MIEQQEEINQEVTTFGYVIEVSNKRILSNVLRPGLDAYCVFYFYEQGMPLCEKINRYLNDLAPLNPETKFVRAIASKCKPHFPEEKLPAVYIYHGDTLKHIFAGPADLRGKRLKRDEFEYMLGAQGAIKTEIKEDPRIKVEDKLVFDFARTTIANDSLFD